MGNQIKNLNIGPFLAFNDAWFDKHQSKLLWLLNGPLSFLFRYIFRINGKRSSVGKRKIEKIQPHYIIWKTGRPNELQAEFRSHPKFSKRIYFAFRPVWWALHFWDWVFADWAKPEWSFGFSTLTAYPDPGGSNVNTQIGRVYNSTGGSYSSTREAASGNYVSNSEDGMNWCQNDTSGGFTVSRIHSSWDTSALTAGATITAATLSGYGVNQGGGNSETDSLNLYSSNPASNTSLAFSDFDYTLFGTTQWATSFAFASWSIGSYNDINLNSTGLSNINKTGVTKIGIRSVKEVAGTQPSSTPCFVSASSANHTGTSQDPKLVITYTNVTTVVKTITAKARILTAGVAKTVTAKARVKQANIAKTVTAKSRIKQANIAYTISAKARIGMGNAKTVTAKGRIFQPGIVKTITAKGRISQPNQAKSLTAKARIKIANIAKTVTAKARVRAPRRGFILMKNSDQTYKKSMSDNRIR